MRCQCLGLGGSLLYAGVLGDKVGETQSLPSEGSQIAVANGWTICQVIGRIDGQGISDNAITTVDCCQRLRFGSCLYLTRIIGNKVGETQSLPCEGSQVAVADGCSVGQIIGRIDGQHKCHHAIAATARLQGLRFGGGLLNTSVLSDKVGEGQSLPCEGSQVAVTDGGVIRRAIERVDRQRKCHHTIATVL